MQRAIIQLRVGRGLHHRFRLIVDWQSSSFDGKKYSRVCRGRFRRSARTTSPLYVAADVRWGGTGFPGPQLKN